MYEMAIADMFYPVGSLLSVGFGSVVFLCWFCSK